MQRKADRRAALAARPEPARDEWSMFAVAAPGLEGVVLDEVTGLPGAREPQAVPGGVLLRGDSATLYRANLLLATATRVLVRLGTVQATDFASLRVQVALLPWERVLALGEAARPLRVAMSVTTHRSALHHTGAIAERVAQALADRSCPVEICSPGEAAALSLVVRGEKDRFTVSADASGERLHRRGWRVEDGGAPLRETLAAGLLRLSGWRDDGSEALWDPMCGAGTILIEAALRLRGLAPGRSRSFAFQQWPTYLPAVFARVAADLARRERPASAGILLGSDADAEVLGAAQRNAERAGVADLIDFAHVPIEAAQLPQRPSGLILCNPPYGRRLEGRGGGLAQIHGRLGRLVRGAPGWRLALLTTEPRLAQAALRAASPSPPQIHPIGNGGLRAALYVTDAGPKSPSLSTRAAVPG